jgi:hypothetical protein
MDRLPENDEARTLDDDVSLAESGTDDDLPPAERARMRRRDHDLAAHDRELMNDGSAKWFKQALDRRVRDADGTRSKDHRPKR